MSLKIVGAGFGRTGTTSLKMALEQLGLGPCFHMFEVRKSAQGAGAWIDACDGVPVDWDAVFEGYDTERQWNATQPLLVALGMSSPCLCLSHRSWTITTLSASLHTSSELSYKVHRHLLKRGGGGSVK